MTRSTLIEIKRHKPMARRGFIDQKGDRWTQCPDCGIKLNLRFRENVEHGFYGCSR
jgi:hypothetical protein